MNIYREASFVADTLAKFSHSLTASQVFIKVYTIHKEAKAYYYLDKIEMIKFRRRKLKRFKEPPLDWIFKFV